MSQGRLKELFFGSAGGIAGTVYGTIVVMATVTAGVERRETDAWRLAVTVDGDRARPLDRPRYAHGLAESLERGRRLDRAELVSVARRELSIPAAALAPVAALVLAAVGVLGEQTAVWLALGIGVVTLGVQGGRYATVEELDRTERLKPSPSTSSSGS